MPLSAGEGATGLGLRFPAWPLVFTVRASSCMASSGNKTKIFWLLSCETLTVSALVVGYDIKRILKDEFLLVLGSCGILNLVSVSVFSRAKTSVSVT